MLLVDRLNAILAPVRVKRRYYEEHGGLVHDIIISDTETAKKLETKPL